MKVIIPLLITFVLYAFPKNAQAQQGNVLQNNITWTSSHSVILNSNTELNISCSVITKVIEDKIILDQGGRLSEFVILQHEGTWTNISENGAILFSITFDGQTGSISVERNSTEVFITIDMTQNPNGVKRKIIVDQIITE